MAVLRAARGRKSAGVARASREEASPGRYRALWEAGRNFIFRLDRGGAVRPLAASPDTIGGWPKARWSDHPFVTLVHPDDVPRAEAAFARAFRGETVERFVLRLRTPRGKPRHVELTLVPEKVRGGVAGALAFANDVTGRTLAEERAGRAERLLRAAERMSQIGSWEWDVASNSLSWSDELYRLHGLRPREIETTPADVLGLVHADDRARVRAALDRALAHPGPFAYEARVLRDGGAVRILETRGESEAGPDGRVTGLVATCLDITARREREDAIRVYQEIFEEIPVGLTVWHVEGESPEAMRLLAYNRHAEERGVGLEFVGRSLAACLPGSRGALLCALLHSVAQSDEARILPRLRFADEPGGGFFEVMAFPLGKRRVAVAMDDVTEKVQAEEARAEAEEKYRRVLESVQAIVWRADPATYRFSFVSRQAETILGYPAERWLSEPTFWVDHLHPDDRRWALSLSQTAIAQGRDHQFELRMIAADGRVVWLRDLVRVISDGGAPREMVGVMIDVTAQRLAEEEVKRSREQLQDLSAHEEWVREEERAAISRVIHDELGQALTALKIDLAWLGGRLGGGGSPPVQDRLAAMSALTDDTINRVRQIAKELRPGVLDDLGLEAALEWQAQDFEARTGVRCTVVSRLGQEPLPRDVATGFFRTFQEALTNVTRHARARQVTVTLDRAGARLNLEVTDDGRGISDEALLERKSLGLLGMRERARRMGGDLVITGRPGEGTTVVLSVPLPEGDGRPRA
jgi:PAS domain S-box-containing protein